MRNPVIYSFVVQNNTTIYKVLIHLNSMNQEMIKSLEKAGFTEGDSKVYLALLELGESSVGEIEKKTQLQRTSIYFSLNKLIEQGLCSFNIKNNVKYFQASKPERISDILEQRKKDFDKILPEMNLFMNKEKQESDVSIFQGYNSLRSVINHRIEILKKGDEILVINPSNIQPLEKYKNLFHHHDLERVKKGISERLITNIKFKDIVKKEYGKYKLRKDRFIDIESPISIIIYEDYIQLATYKGESSEPLIFLIHDKELAKFYRHYFETLWKQAKT